MPENPCSILTGGIFRPIFSFPVYTFIVKNANSRKWAKSCMTNCSKFTHLMHFISIYSTFVSGSVANPRLYSFEKKKSDRNSFEVQSTLIIPWFFITFKQSEFHCKEPLLPPLRCVNVFTPVFLFCSQREGTHSKGHAW